MNNVHSIKASVLKQGKNTSNENFKLVCDKIEKITELFENYCAKLASQNAHDQKHFMVLRMDKNLSIIFLHDPDRKHNPYVSFCDFENKLVAFPVITNENWFLKEEYFTNATANIDKAFIITDRWIASQRTEDLYMIAESEKLAEMYDDFVDEHLVS